MMKLNTALSITTLSTLFVCATCVTVAHAQFLSAPVVDGSVYKGMLIQYQTDAQAFTVAKQEYLQLQTLGKLEVAVNAFREVQLSRGTTLITYYQSLLEMVNKAPGMELEKKEALMTKLQAADDEYKAHLSTVGAAQDRVALEAAAKIFTDKQDDILSLSYESLAMLRIAAVQSALDQLNVAIELVKTHSEQLPETQRAEKQRGFEELSRRMDIVRAAIAKANEFHDRIAGDNNYSDSSYSQVTDILNTGYPELRQAENFLRELAGK